MSGQCRLCGERLFHLFADLGATPLANAFLRQEQLNETEPRYPLRALLCHACFLVQLEALVDPDTLFRNYIYFSSYSDTLLTSSKAYSDMMMQRLGLSRGDRVVEVASNDGYLLQYFLANGMDVLGIEPAANVARVASDKGILTLVRFFGSDVARELAAQGRHARLIVANNVLAHVPDLNDFIAGLKILLQPGGVATLEFHHLLSLIAHHQFDAIYHEHFQYFSLATARAALAAHGLAIVDVEEIPAQGGSLRIYARHQGEAFGHVSCSVADVLAKEDAAGLRSLAPYLTFAGRIESMKRGLLSFLEGARQAGTSVVCYGAAAKGNTLLNYCGVRTDLVDYAVDRSPHKQGLFLPGSRIPIHAPEKVMETKPDYLLILPWNLREEIMEQMSSIRAWGGRFVVPIPEVQVYP